MFCLYVTSRARVGRLPCCLVLTLKDFLVVNMNPKLRNYTGALLPVLEASSRKPTPGYINRESLNTVTARCDFLAASVVITIAFRCCIIATLMLVVNILPTMAQDNESQTKIIPATVGSSTPSTSLTQAQPAAENSMLGLAPPAGAIVLFDGSNFDAWKPFSWAWINPKDNQKEIQWEIQDDGSFKIALEFKGKRRQQTLSTKQKFGKYRLHLEFQLPEAGSGNSGVFFGPLYELQILNSSEKETIGLSDCGAIYQVRKPDVNAGLGPKRMANR